MAWGIEWERLAARYGARFGVIECVCVDEGVQRSRVEGRDRDIPGWYELEWDQVAAGRERYVPLAEPKLRLDASTPIEVNIEMVRHWLGSLSLDE